MYWIMEWKIEAQNDCQFRRRRNCSMALNADISTDSPHRDELPIASKVRTSDVAWLQLHFMVKKRRLLTDVLANDITDFLNTSPLPQERRSRDMTSIWSTIRKSLNYTSCTVSLDTTDIYLVSDDQQIHPG